MWRICLPRKRAGPRSGITIGLAVAAMAPGAVAQTVLTVEEIAPRVRAIHGHPGGNVLVIQTAAGVLLVDAQSASVSDSLLAVLRRIGAERVRLVVSTHYHEDHIGGNSVFRAAGAMVLGHPNLSRRAVVDTTIDELEWHREPAEPDDLPTVEVAADTTFMFGEVAVPVKLRILDAIATGDDVQTAMGRGLATEYQEGRGGERAARRFVGILTLGSRARLSAAARRRGASRTARSHRVRRSA